MAIEPTADATQEARRATDRETCVDYCPNAACACRIRTFAGCSLPLAPDAAGIEPPMPAIERR